MSTTYQLGGYQFAKDLVFGWTIVPIGGSNPVPLSMLDMEDKSLSNYLDSLTYPSWVPQELKEVIAKYISAVYEHHKPVITVPELKTVSVTPQYSSGVEEELAIKLIQKRLLFLRDRAEEKEDADKFQLLSNYVADKVLNLVIIGADRNTAFPSQLEDREFGSFEIQCHGIKSVYLVEKTLGSLIEKRNYLEKIIQKCFPMEVFI